jgi:hypothetical protein
LRTEEALSVLGEADRGLGLGKGVGAERGAWCMLKGDGAELYLLNHKMNAIEEVTYAFVIARKRGGEGDHALVVDVEYSGLKLRKSEFLEKVSEVDDVFDCVNGGVHFALSGAESD